MAGYDFEDLKVLVVDDNRHMRMLFRDLLRTIGVGQVFEADNGLSGFRQLKNADVDVVITDLMMQPIDGLQFARMVRDEALSPDPYVPIVMVTGFADKQRVVEARDAGVTEFLAKPVTTDSLYGRLGAIIERPRPFVRAGSFFGPDRRRRDIPPPPEGDRRSEDNDDGANTPGLRPTTSPLTIAAPDTVDS